MTVPACCGACPRPRSLSDSPALRALGGTRRRSPRPRDRFGVPARASFTANELVALARTFDLPMLYFFMPPEDGRLGLAAPHSPAEGWSWEYLLMLVWGHRENFAVVAQRAAPWAHASPIGYVCADDEHEGRAQAIREAREAGLEDARLRRLAYHRQQR